MCIFCDVSSPVPELVARGVIHQMFPLHEQRILNQLMTSWVQAVCERQPLGRQCQIFISACLYQVTLTKKIHLCM